jgi:hypothetical protein
VHGRCVCLLSVILAACASAPQAVRLSGLDAVDAGEPGPSVAEPRFGTAGSDSPSLEELPEFLRELVPSLAPSLLGTVTSREAGRSEVGRDVHLEQVQVRVKIEAGFAYTEVEEELANDAGEEREAMLAFRAPSGGVIARLGLWVGSTLVDAEVVERPRAAEIYGSIVDRSRRDPALLEQDPSGFVRLRVFPVPAQGRRRVLTAYAEPLEHREGRYNYRLGLRLPPGAPPLGRATVTVDLVGTTIEQVASIPRSWGAELTARETGAQLRWEATETRPRDWHLSFDAPAHRVTTFVPERTTGSERFVALRLTPALPFDSAPKSASVWLIDNSIGQEGPALSASKTLVAKLVNAAPTGERFAILACDTACVSYPDRGLAPVTPDSREAAQRFVSGVAARGASDIGYALFEAASRVKDSQRAQVVYFGDGRPTAGDFEPGEMRARLPFRSEPLDLRLVGVGSTLEPASLGELAASIAAARLIFDGDASDGQRLPRWLAEPVLSAPSVRLPSGLELAYPQQLPSLVRGDEVLLLARLTRTPTASALAELRGKRAWGGRTEPWLEQLALPLPPRDVRADTAPRLWAQARLRDLDDDDAPAAFHDSVELSKRYQVLSRHTSFLALENDAMFRAFDVERRRGRADFVPAPVVAPLSPATRMHRRSVPRLRAGTTRVSGRMPPEAIQKVVRDNDGRFRACYHDGLLRNPELSGTVVTRFVIARDGTVPFARDGGSALPDRKVVDCIARTFAGLVFPAPELPVTVVYPLALSPSAEKQLKRLPTPWVNRSRLPAFASSASSEKPELAAEPALPSAAELAARVELEPTAWELQLAAARAYEREGSERRACAHFRAASALAPRELEAQYQALR